MTWSALHFAFESTLLTTLWHMTSSAARNCWHDELLKLKLVKPTLARKKYLFPFNHFPVRRNGFFSSSLVSSFFFFFTLFQVWWLQTDRRDTKSSRLLTAQTGGIHSALSGLLSKARVWWESLPFWLKENSRVSLEPTGSNLCNSASTESIRESKASWESTSLKEIPALVRKTLPFKAPPSLKWCPVLCTLWLQSERVSFPWWTTSFCSNTVIDSAESTTGHRTLYNIVRKFLKYSLVLIAEQAVPCKFNLFLLFQAKK